MHPSRNVRTTSGRSSACFDGISTERTALDGRSTTGGLIGRMGQHQHEIDDLTRMERLCRDMAEESALPLEGAALLEKARRNSAAGQRAQQLCT